MATESRSGRPRASSREVLSEAACELFLEQGYDATSVSDITQRAGVSRSSFFNYFSGKADVLWGGLDQRIGALEDTLRTDESPDAEHAVRESLLSLAANFTPDSLALAFVNAQPMGLAPLLPREAAVRAARVARATAARFRRGSVPGLRAAVRGAAYGGAVIAAIEIWAHNGPGRAPLVDVLGEALDEIVIAVR